MFLKNVYVMVTLLNVEFEHKVQRFHEIFHYPPIIKFYSVFENVRVNIGEV